MVQLLHAQELLDERSPKPVLRGDPSGLGLGFLGLGREDRLAELRTLQLPTALLGCGNPLSMPLLKRSVLRLLILRHMAHPLPTPASALDSRKGLQDMIPFTRVKRVRSQGVPPRRTAARATGLRAIHPQMVRGAGEVSAELEPIKNRIRVTKVITNNIKLYPKLL